MNLLLCFDGSNQKIIPVENDSTAETAAVTANQVDTPPPYVPKPMNLLPATLPYVATETVAAVPTSDTKCFQRFTEAKDCNYLETIRRKIFPKKTDAVKDKPVDKKVKLKSDNGTDAEKTSGNQVHFLLAFRFILMCFLLYAMSGYMRRPIPNAITNVVCD